VAETISGVVVARAFNIQQQLIEQNMALIDNNHKTLFNLHCIQLWLAFRLDTIASLLVAGTALFCVGFKDGLAPSTAGLAILNSIQMIVFFTLFIKGIAETLSNTSAIQRIVHYIQTIKTESEMANLKLETHSTIENTSITLPKHWPHEGKIVYKHATMRYAEELPLVLNRTSFDVKPGEKIGVVGRTGSGKSSLLMALFRLVELEGGCIMIDGVNIRDCNLHELRSRLAIIPQEPVLFKGTIRSNLDPFQLVSDSDIWRALELSHLKSFIMQFPEKLDSFIDTGGGNFSLGQKQLLCLARAILKQSKILVLDEATSAMDLETDQLIQNTISTVFAENTIITIAHRLDTILGSDRILVLDSGQVVEFNTKDELLKNPNGIFTTLLAEAGLALMEERKPFEMVEKRVSERKMMVKKRFSTRSCREEASIHEEVSAHIPEEEESDLQEELRERIHNLHANVMENDLLIERDTTLMSQQKRSNSFDDGAAEENQTKYNDPKWKSKFMDEMAIVQPSSYMHENRIQSPDAFYSTIQ
jgi:ABC-type multidrug transport system fused ATPase/permease subunit